LFWSTVRCRRIRLGEIDGPVLLVGHSYGGSVMTAAGTADNVVGLVYISGFAPDEGENLTDLFHARARGLSRVVLRRPPGR
jgi:pimeloyl-ACP methyl ester carboxylesterase